MTMVMDSSAAVDVESREMRIDGKLDRALSDQDDIEFRQEFYIIGDMLYTFRDVPENHPMWVKLRMPEGTWEIMSQTEAQIGFLKTAQIKIIGSEEIQGIDCYVFELTLDIELIWQIAKQQTAMGAEVILDIPEEFLQEIFHSSSLKQWIAKDTHYLTKVEMEIAIELTAEAMGVQEEEVFEDITVIWLFYDHNLSIDVMLPLEAEEAIEVSSLN